jgi:hypothetical protein
LLSQFNSESIQVSEKNPLKLFDERMHTI